MKILKRFILALAMTLMLNCLVSCSNKNEDVFDVSGNKQDSEQINNVSDDKLDDSSEHSANESLNEGKNDKSDKEQDDKNHPEKLPYGISESYAEPGCELHFFGYKAGTVFTVTVDDRKSDDVRSFTTETPSFTPEVNDMEAFLTIEAEGYEKVSMYMSTFPVIYIDCDKNYYNIGDLNTPTYIRLQPSMNINYGDISEDCFYEGAAEIHLRGNSTKYRQKRPFKLKLEKKTDLLGLTPEKSKHYVLLAQDIDHTLIRNKLLMDLSGKLGDPTALDSENVSLVYNGQYYGVYLLTEHVRVGKGRVDIFDWDDTYKDDEGKEYPLWWNADANDMTGGFLLEMDFYAFEENDQANLITAYKQPLYFNSPEPSPVKLPIFKKSALYANAKSYIQSFEYALHANDFFYRNEDEHFTAQVNSWGWRHDVKYKASSFTDDIHDGLHYSELFDMDSLVNNFLFCELAMNWDSMKNSFFVYKDIEGPAFVGPQWDFDWALGNINMYGINTWYPNSWHTTEDAFAVEQYYQTVQWNRMLIRDPYFLCLAYEKWKSIRADVIEDIVKNEGVLDQYRERYKLLGAANDYRWGETYDDPSAYSLNSKDYRGSFDSLKQFVNKRISWLDTQFETMDSFVNSLGIYRKDENIQVEVNKSNGEYTANITVHCDSDEEPAAESDIKGISVQINGKNIYRIMFEDSEIDSLVKNLKFIADEDKYLIDFQIPTEVLNPVGSVNCVEVKALGSDARYLTNDKYSKTGNYYLTISNFASFIAE